MQPRRQARELALQLLFQSEFDSSFELATTLQRFIDNFKTPSEVLEYGNPLLQGVFLHKPELDQTIQAASKNWKIPRMSAVDRNILRIAVFELLHNSDIPPRVAINEAVELAKTYGNADSAQFVNGILDQIAKERRIL